VVVHRRRTRRRDPRRFGGFARARAAAGPPPELRLAAAERLAAGRAGPVEGPTKLYLCHILCELGALDAVGALREVRDWMDRHPREVLVIVVEDAAPAAVIKASSARSR
jgi:hypothetical protein